MICYCGKGTWEYSPGVLTCKDGHRTVVKDAVVEQLPAPEGYEHLTPEATTRRAWPTRLAAVAALAATASLYPAVEYLL